jgi:hypothetical protein
VTVACGKQRWQRGLSCWSKEAELRKLGGCASRGNRGAMLSDVVQLQLDMVVSIAFSVRVFLQDISIASHHQPPLPLVHIAHTHFLRTLPAAQHTSCLPLHDTLRSLVDVAVVPSPLLPAARLLLVCLHC